MQQWQREGREVVIIDVREDVEYTEGHLDGAINIPYAQIEARLDEINPDVPNVVYCIYSSWRAPYAANLLADLGYSNIYVMEGRDLGVECRRAGDLSDRNGRYARSHCGLSEGVA